MLNGSAQKEQRQHVSRDVPESNFGVDGGMGKTVGQPVPDEVHSVRLQCKPLSQQMVDRLAFDVGCGHGREHVQHKHSHVDRDDDRNHRPVGGLGAKLANVAGFSVVTEIGSVFDAHGQVEPRIEKMERPIRSDTCGSTMIESSLVQSDRNCGIGHRIRYA